MPSSDTCRLLLPSPLAPPAGFPPRGSRVRSLRATVLAAVLAALLPAGTLLAQSLEKPGGSALRSRRALRNALQPSEAELSQRLTPVVRAVRATAESVVSVLIINPDRRRRGRTVGQGSGVIIDESGLVLTNWHVVAYATAAGGGGSVRVTVKDGKSYRARVMSSSAEHDLALLQLVLPDGDRVKPLTMGDSDSLMIGETLIAIGNPKGHANTVTVGVLSQRDRSHR